MNSHHSDVHVSYNVDVHTSTDTYDEPMRTLYMRLFPGEAHPSFMSMYSVDGILPGSVLKQVFEAAGADVSGVPAGEWAITDIQEYIKLPKSVDVYGVQPTFQVGLYRPSPSRSSKDRSYMTLVGQCGRSVIKVTTTVDTLAVYDEDDLFELTSNVTPSYQTEEQNYQVCIATSDKAIHKTFREVMEKVRMLTFVASDPVINIVTTNSAGNLSLMSHPVTKPTYLEGTDSARETAELTTFIGSQIDKKRRGLILLHGKPGSGKTSCIRHLIHTYPTTQFVVMPPEIFEQAGTPSFLRFMVQQCQGAVLIVEDAERILTKRAEADSSIGISTLLNMGDGLLSDVLSTPIICTFNMDVQHIDTAVMRSGRLIKRHEFKSLSQNDARAILENLKVPYAGSVGDGVTVADVYQAASMIESGDPDLINDAHTLLGKSEKSFGFRSK